MTNREATSHPAPVGALERLVFEAVVSGIDDVPGVLDGLDDGLRALAVKDRPRRRFLMATEELSVNAFMHGGASEQSPVRVHLGKNTASFMVRISFNGRAFDPTDPAAVGEADPMSLGGNGLRLVQGLVDRISYDRIGETNLVSLRGTI